MNELEAVITPGVNQYNEQIYNIGIAWRGIVIKERYLLRPAYSQEAAQRKKRKLQQDLDNGHYNAKSMEEYKFQAESVLLSELYRLLKEIDSLSGENVSISLFADGSGQLVYPLKNAYGWPVEPVEKAWGTLQAGVLVLNYMVKKMREKDGE